VQLCMWFCSALSAGVSLISGFLMLMRLLFSAHHIGSAHDGVKLFTIVENLEQVKLLA
jgi:hypothetical protein